MDFEELDHSRTPLGELSLRRRADPVLGEAVLEVKLDDDFLMSSRFTAGEIALAERGLAVLQAPRPEVAVGGLGLGYTAAAVLAHEAVRSLLVIELLAPVLDWHRRGLVPLGAKLRADPRCRLMQGDFFALAQQGGLDPEHPGRRFDAVLVDIDHSPRHVLDPRRRAFYAVEGLVSIARQLRAGGVFALWSNEPPDAAFERVLEAVFASSQAQVVRFDNPYTGGESVNTIYVACATRSATGPHHADDMPER
jgi:spermidine synthase